MDFFKLNEAVKLVVKGVDKMRKRMLFKALTDELSYQYGYLLLQCDVKWLSEGFVLNQFIDTLSGLIEFISIGEVWWQNFAF